MSFDGKPIIESIKKRGWIWDQADNTFYPPNSDRAKELNSQTYVNTAQNKSGLNRLKSASKQKRVKTGWIDDTLNIKNKNNRFDKFITLVRLDLALDVWPEFYFTIEKQYRFDYAIPLHTTGAILRIAIECDGGVWRKGGGAHSHPLNIERDIEKSTLAAVEGWTVIRRVPETLCTSETIYLIRRAVENLIRMT